MWRLIQEQILGMKWLNEGVGKLLSLIGIDMTTRLGGAFQFFFYRTSLSTHVHSSSSKVLR